jgi:hypothetical protein
MMVNDDSDIRHYCTTIMLGGLLYQGQIATHDPPWVGINRLPILRLCDKQLRFEVVAKRAISISREWITNAFDSIVGYYNCFWISQVQHL